MSIDEATAQVGLGTWLAQLRNRAGMTQAELAQAATVGVRSLQRWESGSNQPKGSELLRLFDALGVKVTPPAPDEVGLSVAGQLRDIRSALERADLAIVALSELAPPEAKQAVLQAGIKALEAAAGRDLLTAGGTPIPIGETADTVQARALQEAVEAALSDVARADDVQQGFEALQEAIRRLAKSRTRGGGQTRKKPA